MIIKYGLTININTSILIIRRNKGERNDSIMGGGGDINYWSCSGVDRRERRIIWKPYT